MQDEKQILEQKFSHISTSLNSATFAKPTVSSKFIKVKIDKECKEKYFAQMFTNTQVFHKNLNSLELMDFLKENVGINFKHIYRNK